MAWTLSWEEARAQPRDIMGCWRWLITTTTSILPMCQVWIVWFLFIWFKWRAQNVLKLFFIYLIEHKFTWVLLRFSYGDKLHHYFFIFFFGYNFTHLIRRMAFLKLIHFLETLTYGAKTLYNGVRSIRSNNSSIGFRCYMTFILFKQLLTWLVG